MRYGKRNVRNVVDRLHCKVQIFKQEEQRQIANDRNDQEAFFFRGSPGAVDAEGQQIIACDGGDHHRNKERFAPRIEKQARCKQHEVTRARRADEKMQQQYRREKKECKLDARKNHTAILSQT